VKNVYGYEIFQSASDYIYYYYYYYWGDQKQGEMGGHVERTGEMRNAYNILVRKPEGKPHA
jgi:hypothetical protein